jgi:hypothetical protein
MWRSIVGIILILALGCLVAPHTAEAQQAGKVYRIGVLGLGSAADMVFDIEPLRQGLRELGYVVGRNLALEYRVAEGLSRAPCRCLTVPTPRATADSRTAR